MLISSNVTTEQTSQGEKMSIEKRKGSGECRESCVVCERGRGGKKK